MVARRATSASPLAKPSTTAFDPVWSYILSDYSDSDEVEDDEEDYPPRQKKVSWGRLPTRFDASDEDDDQDDHDDESNYLYMVPKRSSASSVLKSLLSFSDNDDDQDEVVDDAELASGRSGGEQTIVLPSSPHAKNSTDESKSEPKVESKLLSYLFSGANNNNDGEVSKELQSKQEGTSFFKSLFSSDDESRDGQGRLCKSTPMEEESRDGIPSRFSIWSWTSDEGDSDEAAENSQRRPVNSRRVARKRFLSKQQRKMQAHGTKESKTSEPIVDEKESEQVEDTAEASINPDQTMGIADASVRSDLGERPGITSLSQSSCDSKELRGLYVRFGRSGSGTTEENDCESVSSRRSVTSKGSGGARILFGTGKKSKSLPMEENDGSSVTSRRSIGSAVDVLKLFSAARRSSSPLTEESDGASSSSKRSVTSNEAGRRSRIIRVSSSPRQNENDGGSIAASRKSGGSHDASVPVFGSVVKVLSKERNEEGIASPVSLPTRNECGRLPKADLENDRQKKQVIEGILRNQNSVATGLVHEVEEEELVALEQTKEEYHHGTRLSWRESPFDSEVEVERQPSTALELTKEEYHDGTRLSWRESPFDSEVEVERQQPSTKGITHQKRRSFLAKVKEKKMMRTLSWPPKRKKSRKTSSSRKVEGQSDPPCVPDQVEMDLDNKESNSPILQEVIVKVENLGAPEEPVGDFLQEASPVPDSSRSISMSKTGNESRGCSNLHRQREDYTNGHAIINSDTGSGAFWRFHAQDAEDKEVEPPPIICGVNAANISGNTLKSADVDHSQSTSKEPFSHFQALARNLVYFADALDLFSPFDNENPDDSETLTTADEGSMTSDLADDGTFDGNDLPSFVCHPSYSVKPLMPPPDDEDFRQYESSNQEKSLATQGNSDQSPKSASSVVTQSVDSIITVPPEPFNPLDAASCEISGDKENGTVIALQSVVEKREVTEIRLTFRPIRERPEEPVAEAAHIDVADAMQETRVTELTHRLEETYQPPFVEFLQEPNQNHSMPFAEETMVSRGNRWMKAPLTLLNSDVPFTKRSRVMRGQSSRNAFTPAHKPRSGKATRTAAEVALLPRPDGSTDDDEQLEQAHVLSIEDWPSRDQPSAKDVTDAQQCKPETAPFREETKEQKGELRSMTEVGSFLNDPKPHANNRSPFQTATSESSDIWSFRSDDKMSSEFTLSPRSTRTVSPGPSDFWAKPSFRSLTTESSDVWSFKGDNPENDEADPFGLVATEDSATRDIWSPEHVHDPTVAKGPVDWHRPELDDGSWQWPIEEQHDEASVDSEHSEFGDFVYIGDIYENNVEAASSDVVEYISASSSIAASSSICSRLTDDLTTLDGSYERLDEVLQGKASRSSSSQTLLRRLACRRPTIPLTYRSSQEVSPEILSKIVCCTYKPPQTTGLLVGSQFRSEDISVNFPAARILSDSECLGLVEPSKVANMITISDFMETTSENPIAGPQVLFTYDYNCKQHLDVVYNQHGSNAIDLLEVRLHRRPPFLANGSNEALIQIEASTVSLTDCEIRGGKTWGNRVLPLPTVPGVDFIGRIRQVGKKFSRRFGLDVGDRVMSLVKFGGNSRYIVVPDDRLVKVPDELDAAEAVAMAETYLSAFQALHIGQSGVIRYGSTSLQGKTIFVVGALTNVGRAIVELARVGGATCVYGTCKPKQFKTLEAIGAVALSPDASRWPSFFHDRVDVMLVVRDRSNEAVTTDHLNAIKATGRVVFMGNRRDNDIQMSSVNEAAPTQLFCKKIKSAHFKANNVMCYDVYQQWDRFNERSKVDLSHLLSLLQQHRVKPRVLDRIPLRKVAKAQELLDSKRLSGILVCEPWLKDKQRAMFM